MADYERLFGGNPINYEAIAHGLVEDLKVFWAKKEEAALAEEARKSKIRSVAELNREEPMWECSSLEDRFSHREENFFAYLLCDMSEEKMVQTLAAFMSSQSLDYTGFITLRSHSFGFHPETLGVDPHPGKTSRSSKIGMRACQYWEGDYKNEDDYGD